MFLLIQGFQPLHFRWNRPYTVKGHVLRFLRQDMVAAVPNSSQSPPGPCCGIWKPAEGQGQFFGMLFMPIRNIRVRMKTRISVHWAVTTKCHKHGSYKPQKFTSHGSGEITLWLVRVPFLVRRWLSSSCALIWQKGGGSSLGSLL